MPNKELLEALEDVRAAIKRDRDEGTRSSAYALDSACCSAITALAPPPEASGEKCGGSGKLYPLHPSRAVVHRCPGCADCTPPQSQAPVGSPLIGPSGYPRCPGCDGSIWDKAAGGIRCRVCTKFLPWHTCEARKGKRECMECARIDAYNEGFHDGIVSQEATNGQ